MDKQELIDSLHWKEYTFIGQEDAIFEGILTQESEEQIADKLLALIEPLIEQTIKDDADRCAGYRDGWVEEAKKQERGAITSIIKEYKLESASVRDDMLELRAEGWKLLWQALQEEK